MVSYPDLVALWFNSTPGDRLAIEQVMRKRLEEYSTTMREGIFEQSRKVGLKVKVFFFSDSPSYQAYGEGIDIEELILTQAELEDLEKAFAAAQNGGKGCHGRLKAKVKPNHVLNQKQIDDLAHIGFSTTDVLFFKH